jgi:hypothetical protein
MISPREAKFYAYQKRGDGIVVWGFGETEIEALRCAQAGVHTMVELHVAPMNPTMHALAESMLRDRVFDYILPDEAFDK